jgi:tRNA threonylcarbamoyladenosine biosynthesis protein TsaB
MEAPLNPTGKTGRVLALESSGVLAGVALTEGDLLLGEAALDTRRSRAEHLLALAGRLLDDLGLQVGDLDRLAISEGPGSFTGLRVGMASALGMAVGSGLHVVPVGSLEVLAYPWRLCDGVIVPVSGYRRGQLYFTALRWDGVRFAHLLEPVSAPLETMFERCSSLEAERLLFVGDALDSLAGLIRSRLGDRAGRISADPPRASSLARLAQDPDRPAWTGAELEGRTPRYLRDADARKPKPRPRA